MNGKHLLSALVCLVALHLTSATSLASGSFFPIGLFEAGVFPRDWRSRVEIWPGCAETNPDTAFNAPEWSSLDDIRGDTETDTTFGYSSGFNVVQDFFYRGEAGEITRYDVYRYLKAAEELHFKVLMTLPAMENPYPPLAERHHFYQRTPAVYAHADTLITTFRSDTTVYAWYLVDELELPRFRGQFVSWVSSPRV